MKWASREQNEMELKKDVPSQKEVLTKRKEEKISGNANKDFENKINSIILMREKGTGKNPRVMN